MILSDSSNRATRWSFGNPNASYSGSCHPAPSPRITRPALTSSALTAIFAVSPGLRKLVQSTRVPISTRSVLAATALTIVHASCIPWIDPASV